MDLDEYFGSPEEYLEEKGKHKAGKLPCNYCLEITKEGKRYVHLWILTIQKDKFYTSYPIVFPILNLPFYAIAKLWLNLDQITLLDLPTAESELNKLDNFISAFWTAVGGLFLFLFIWKEYGLKEAIFSNILYCFMSPAFSLLSHNTWQQTLNVALFPILLLLLKTEKNWAQVLFGFIFTIFLFNRPTNLFFLPILFLGNWKNFGYWTLGGIVPFVFFMSLHIFIYSHPLGGYYYHGRMIGGSLVFSKPFSEILGLLLSPARGLLVYQPYLLVVLLLSLFLKKDKNFLIYLFCLFLSLSFYSSYTIWDAGWNYGPRFLSDLLPIFLILTVQVWQRFQRNLFIKVAFYFTLVLSFWIHIQPALGKDFFKWEACYLHPISHENKLWDWKYTPITALSYKYRLLWLSEIHIQTKELCHTTQDIREDFTLEFQKENFKSELNFLGKYFLVKDTEFYFPKGSFQLSLDAPSKEISLLLKSRSKTVEPSLVNESYFFKIEKSGIYNVNLYVNEPINYHLKSIVIKKLEENK
ncbi:MAG: hypothetical protein N3A69_02480 [Leptospiraceae bacterium]|nr:hypothetical protein [Leptospiraceae bacterium]